MILPGMVQSVFDLLESTAHGRRLCGCTYFRGRYIKMAYRILGGLEWKRQQVTLSNYTWRPRSVMRQVQRKANSARDCSRYLSASQALGRQVHATSGGGGTQLLCS